jgi:hypothetical protein
MKNLIILLAFTILPAFHGFTSSTANDGYVCKGKSSKKYHYKTNCRGLSNCSTNIYNVSIIEARNMGRTLCGWED